MRFLRGLYPSLTKEKLVTPIYFFRLNMKVYVSCIYLSGFIGCFPNEWNESFYALLLEKIYEF